MTKSSDLSYEKISDGARFREQYRFAFSVAVIATVFVIPSDNILSEFLKGVLYCSAFFAALYLISSAACMKYSEPGRLYEVFYVGERFRMRMYDWSLHVFAIGLLFFIGSIITGLINSIPGVHIGSFWTWTVLIASAIAVSVGVLFMSMAMEAREPSKKKTLPKI